MLHEFYDEFEPLVEKAFHEMEKKGPEETGEVCPECGNSLVIRKGKFGEFVACSNYPTCKYIKKDKKEVVEICKCPKCDKGMIVERKTKKVKFSMDAITIQNVNMHYGINQTGIFVQNVVN